MTIPTGTGAPQNGVRGTWQGYDFETVAQSIKSDEYFVHDETHVFKVDDVEA